MKEEPESSRRSEAEAALAAARRTEQATRYPEVPWWFLLLNAVLMTAMALTPLAGDRSEEYLGATAIAIIAANLVASRFSGRMGTRSATKTYVAILGAVFVLIFVGRGVYEWRGYSEVVYAVAGLVFVLMLVAGATYRRIPRGLDGTP